jgi:hypothetical protein
MVRYYLYFLPNGCFCSSLADCMLIQHLAQLFNMLRVRAAAATYHANLLVSAYKIA